MSPATANSSDHFWRAPDFRDLRAPLADDEDDGDGGGDDEGGSRGKEGEEGGG